MFAADASWYLPLTSHTFKQWMLGFAFTQCLEIPIYLWGLRHLPLRQRFFVAFGASAITHPLVWFAVPWYMPGAATRWVLFFAVEGAVVGVEGYYLKQWGRTRPWHWALLANAVSAATGEVMHVIWPGWMG